MADYLIKGETLKAIADSIREKRKTSTTYTPTDFPAEILAITGGDNPIVAANDTQMNGLLVADNAGKVVYKSASGSYDIGYYLITESIAFDRLYLASEIPSEEATFTENGVYTFSGVGGYKKVTVNVDSVVVEEVVLGYQKKEEGTKIAFEKMSDLPSGGGSELESVLDGTVTEISNNNITVLRAGAFQNCSSLVSASFGECTSLGNNAFYYCTSLSQISLPKCETIGSSAFNNCRSLVNVSFPVCTNIGSQAFYYCTSLNTIEFPACSIIYSAAFSYCTQLTTASFPACTSIGNSAFAYCSRLLSLYLLGSKVCSLANINAFYNTPISTYTTATSGVFGSIYVPASLLASYQTAANWSKYSSRFVGV